MESYYLFIININQDNKYCFAKVVKESISFLFNNFKKSEKDFLGILTMENVTYLLTVALIALFHPSTNAFLSSTFIVGVNFLSICHCVCNASIFSQTPTASPAK